MKKMTRIITLNDEAFYHFPLILSLIKHEEKMGVVCIKEAQKNVPHK
jgi:hypothetical protein